VGIREVFFTSILSHGEVTEEMLETNAIRRNPPLYLWMQMSQPRLYGTGKLKSDDTEEDISASLPGYA
jgi:hypothetical protein